MKTDIKFLVPHLIGNPVDAIDTFIQLAKKQIQNGKYTEALEILNEADKSVEDAKTRINDFRIGKYNQPEKPIGTYIAVFVDGEYKNILIVQAEDIDDADIKLKEEGWEGWSSLNAIEYDLQGICFAVNGLR